MSAADELAEFYVHTVTVTPKAGDSPYGPAYGDPFTLACFVDETTRLVRGLDGAEVVSSATLTTAPGVDVPVGSDVALPSGRATTVLGVAHADSGPLDLPDHAAITLA